MRKVKFMGKLSHHVLEREKSPYNTCNEADCKEGVTHLTSWSDGFNRIDEFHDKKQYWMY